MFHQNCSFWPDSNNMPKEKIAPSENKTGQSWEGPTTSKTAHFKILYLFQFFICHCSQNCCSCACSICFVFIYKSFPQRNVECLKEMQCVCKRSKKTNIVIRLTCDRIKKDRWCASKMIAHCHHCKPFRFSIFDIRQRCLRVHKYLYLKKIYQNICLHIRPIEQHQLS